MSLFLILAFVCGAVSIVSKMMNFKLTEHLGLFNGALVNYVTASFLSILIILISRNNNIFNLEVLRNVPLFLYLGGACGLVALLLGIIVIPKLPIFYSTILLLIGQLGTAFVIDAIIDKNVSFIKLLGIALVILGMWLDKKITLEYHKASKIA